MLTYFTKILLLMLLAVSTHVPLLSGEACFLPQPKQATLKAEPLNLIQEDETSLLAEASPFYILTTI